MRKFFGGIYGSSFFGGILWGNSSGIVNCSNFQMLTGFLHFQSQPIFYILNKKNLFVCQDSDFCQDFVSIKEGRRTNLDP